MNTLNNDCNIDFDDWGNDYRDVDDNPLLIERGKYKTFSELLDSVNHRFMNDYGSMSSELLARRV